MNENDLSLHNESCSLRFDPEGAALTDFHLHDQVNPLNFRVQQESAGSTLNFKGHFTCIGHWGDPSPGELHAGHVKHGELAQLPWNSSKQNSTLSFWCSSEREGWTTKKKITLDQNAACYYAEEEITNTQSTGRLFNVVQHPTIAKPFLDASTIIDCNANSCFDYGFEHYTTNIMCHWPEVLTTEGPCINLRKQDSSYNSVFPSLIDPSSPIGWITAYSPTHQLLLGYAWKRSHYPWINHWLHSEPQGVMYRGMEFGTTGIHKSLKEIWEQRLTSLLDEPTSRFIDAGESQSRFYFSFLVNIPRPIKGISKITVQPNQFILSETGAGNSITINHQFDNYVI